MNPLSLNLSLPGSLNRLFPGSLLAVLFLATLSSVSAAPAITDPTFVSIDATEALLSATVTDLDGSRGLERGFVLAPAASNSDPLIGGLSVTKVSRTGGLGSFSLTAAALSPATTYAVKSFIRTNVATSYSAVFFFTTVTTVEFTSGVAMVSGRTITPGESQVFELHIPDSSTVVFAGTGATGSMTWEIRDVLDTVVASGSGDLSFTDPLAWGDYQIRISNGGASTETFSLDLDISTLANPKPDIAVGNTPSPTIGADVYSPASQVSVNTTNKALPKDFYFHIDNDDVLPDAMRIYATASDNLFRVTYYIGARNVTAAAIVGIAGTGIIGPNDAPVSVRARVAPNRRNSRIRDTVIVSGRRTIVYGSESFIGHMTVTSSTDINISDTATFQLNTLP